MVQMRCMYNYFKLSLQVTKRNRANTALVMQQSVYVLSEPYFVFTVPFQYLQVRTYVYHLNHAYTTCSNMQKHVCHSLLHCKKKEKF